MEEFQARYARAHGVYAKRSLGVAYDMQYRFSADFDWCIPQ